MIDFQFELDFSLVDDSTTGFDLGHITVISNGKKFSSKEKSPSQAMMIFLSIIDLMDGFRKNIMNAGKNAIYEFIAVDSSFSILFKKEMNRVKIHVNREFVGEGTTNKIFETIKEAANDFITENLEKLPKDDPVYEDIRIAFSEFQNVSEK